VIVEAKKNATQVQTEIFSKH